ncbi:hypothetical protein [Nocardia flavorosea]|uniref:hypothetical protein n=1 Tax=Nocardia flavorosea TaxID=53429 RepID=UPI002456EE6D|nr:hypothetical protein [Nocardia flavorosea]
MGAQRAGRWTRWLPAGYSLLLTLLITAPLLRPGYLLLRDAVSIPRSYLTDTALGLGDAAPRAVPQDALLATLSVLVDGGVVVKAILVAALWAAGYGAALLARHLLRAPLTAQLAATTLTVWNPYVAERLLQGHWSLLTGYAALPWIALAALRVRRGGTTAEAGSIIPPDTTATEPRSGDRVGPDARPDSGNGPERAPEPAIRFPVLRRKATELTGTGFGSCAFRNWAVLVGLLAAAGLTPTGALLGAIVAVAIAGGRRLAGVLLLVVAACLPWLLATAVSGVAAEPSDPAGVPAFAARAEPWLGTVGSLAGLGGIWNADAVPDSRTTPLAAAATVLLLAVVAFGIRRVAAADGDPERTRARRILLVLAAAAVALPALAAPPAGLAVMEWLVVHIPGTGLLRDTQKFVALAVPGYALCAAAACSIATGRRSTDDAAAQYEDSTLVPGSAGPAPVSPADNRPGIDRLPDPASGGTHRDTGSAPHGPASQGIPAPTSTEPAASAPGGLTGSRPGDAPASHSGGDSGGTESRPGGNATGLHTERAEGSGADRPISPGSGGTGGGPAAGASDSVPPEETQTTGIPAADRPEPVHASIALTVLFIGMLLLPLPDLGWGVGGQMRAVQYPDSWAEVAERIDGPGDIAVLPGGMFRRFPYSGTAPVLDPAPRMLPRDVLQTGALPVRDETVTGEGTRAQTVEDLLLTGGDAAELARLGVGWVLVERDSPGPLGESATTLAQLNQVFDSEELRLYQVPGVALRPAPEDRALLIGAHILWALLLVTPLLATLLPRIRRRRTLD